VDKLSGISDGTKEEIGKMAKYFQYMTDTIEKKALLYDIITHIEGLALEEAIKAFDTIVADKRKKRLIAFS